MAKSTISIIAAIGKNRELGRDNKLLWHLPEDLKRFKELTNGHPIIMGRKTFESIGRVLPNRVNIVISRDKKKVKSDKKYDGTVIVESLEEAVEVANKSVILNGGEGSTKGKDSSAIPQNDNTYGEIFIIGGGQIFEQAMPIADRLYLTIVNKEYPDADVFFPEFSKFKTQLDIKRKVISGQPVTFLTLEKDSTSQ